MKKALKIVGYILAGLLLLAVLAAAFIHFRGMPKAEFIAPDLAIEADSAMLARGAALVSTVCAYCHRGPNGALEGKLMADAGPLGIFYAPNITRHPKSEASKYNDGELAYLLRTGIKKDGHISLPFMPRLASMSDYDLNSIIAFLRSDAPIVQASENRTPSQKYTLLTKFVGPMMMKTLPYPQKTITSPPLSDSVAYGRYLAISALECYGCHSASFETNDIANPEKSLGYMAGGNLVEDEDKKLIPSANLTPHPNLGIGSWTADQFAECVRNGRRPDGTMVSSAMPKLNAFSHEEIKTIWAYLQTLAPNAHDVRQAAAK